MILYGPINKQGLDTHDVRATLIFVVVAYIVFKLIDALLEYAYMSVFDIIKMWFSQ
jgi:hypothetical protein